MNRMLRVLSLPAAVLAIASLAPPAHAEATATLRDRAGKEVGKVTLRETPNGVLVHAKLDGIPPGEHGFHVHEHGVCSGDFASAGGHFAPSGGPHGFLDAKGPHAGDLPNVFVPESGKLEVEMRAADLKLAEGSGMLFDADGAAVVVHADADDYRTQPAGDAGERIACGVLER